MEVKLKDVMTRSFRFLISDEFRHDLFNRAIEKERMIKNLAEKLGCKSDSIRIMKIGQTKFIKWQIVKKLIEIVGISEEELEPHIFTIKGGMTGKVTEVKFPIKESPELAMLVAKGMGDGTIEKDKFRFSFWNKKEELIKEVCDCVNKAIGKTRGTINKLKDGRIQVKFCPFVAFVLHKSGVPIGNKTLQDFDVPDWIKNGSSEVKASFIKGLFDDEACIKMKSKKNRSREIIFAQGKSAELRNSLENFFNSIKMMLLEFDINSGNITEQETFIDKNGIQKIVLRFVISKKENLEKFLDRIGFTDLKKRTKLKESLESFVDIHKTKRNILETVLKSSNPLSTTEISKMVGIDRNLALIHLNELVKSNKIFKNKATTPNLWFKEDLSFIISNREKILETIKNFVPITVKKYPR